MLLEPVLSRLLSTIALILGLTVAGCDTAGERQAQESRAADVAAAGEVDRSRAGEMIPEVSLSGSQDRVANLHDLTGTPVLLNLWATWCAPCVKEMPQLDALAARGAGLRVIAASQDVQGAAVVEPFFERTGLRHLEPWTDPENLLMEKLEIETLPVTILYDADGREVWRMTGAFDWSSARAADLIAQGYTGR